MLADYHTHTVYSDDSEYLMEDAVRDAIALGLDEICFTDHVDYGVKFDWSEKEKIYSRGGFLMANVDYPRYDAEIAELRDKYRGKISIKEGLEFGMQRHTIGKFRELFSRYKFDFIILSCHQACDKEFCTQEFQAGKSQLEYNRRYYEEILAVMSEYKDYSVLGHLDMIVRYDLQGKIAFEMVSDLVEAILRKAIADGKGIELNTSCRRYKIGDLTPSRRILSLYRSLGGEIITIGSDSHKKEQLGAGIAEAKRELKSLGFSRFCTFERMRPVFHEL